MIDASFSRTGRSATVNGAYQYDTGQRLRMYGLPSPDELSERDDFLSGDVVTVQAQYSFVGDAQTESRSAAWDDLEGAWTAAIPDVYMMRSEDVHVYVYVSYGQTEESMRAKTCYEAVFRPESRPAPSNQVTPDQTNAWDALVMEVNLALTNVGLATSGANAAATKADEAAARLEGLEASAVTLAPGSAATAKVTTTAGVKHIEIGVPHGEKGEKGDPGVFKINGKEVTNEADITLTAADVGALPKDHQTVFEFTATIPALWYPAGATGVYLTSASIAGILATDRPVIDINYGDPTAMDEIIEAWGMIQKIETYDGGITATCYRNMPPVPIPIKLLCVR